jgi:hypothetical protein
MAIDMYMHISWLSYHMYSYAVTNAIFLAILIYVAWISVHMLVACNVLSSLLYDIIVPDTATLTAHIGALFTLLVRIGLFWMVHSVDENSGAARITQYRWFCFFDLCFFMSTLRALHDHELNFVDVCHCACANLISYFMIMIKADPDPGLLEFELSSSIIHMLSCQYIYLLICIYMD